MPIEISNYKAWRDAFETEKVFTRRDMADQLAAQRRQLTVNRVVQSFTGLYGPDDCRAMQILAIHERPEGLLIIVR